MSVKDEINEILYGVLCVGACDDIPGDSSLVNDLGMDSIDEVEIILEVEEVFDITIQGNLDAEWKDIETVDDLVHFVEVNKKV